MLEWLLMVWSGIKLVLAALAVIYFFIIIGAIFYGIDKAIQNHEERQREKFWDAMEERQKAKALFIQDCMDQHAQRMMQEWNY